MSISIEDKDIELFQDLICRKSGIYLNGSGLDTLRAGLYARVESKGFVSPSRYYGYLCFHPEGQQELEELISYITINETYFFRNAGHFAALRNHVLVKLMEDKAKSGGVIRIWSAGCSTGEEPYSIAMAVMDVAAKKDAASLRVSILGTDVDKEALAKAERGIYGERALRVTEDKYKSRYFNCRVADYEDKKIYPFLAVGDPTYEIDKTLRDIVRFKSFNLMETQYPKPPAEPGGGWDIIFCRNVVIYFNKESLSHVASSFANVLSNNGYLFMGHSETLDGVTDEFSLVELGGAYVYVKKQASPGWKDAAKGRRGDAANLHVPASPLKAKPSVPPSPGSPRTRGRVAPSPRRPIAPSPQKPERMFRTKRELPEDTELIYREAVELFAHEQPAFASAALSKIETYIESKPEDARGHLLAGKIYADRGNYEGAVDEFEKSIKLEPLLTEAHYLLGVIYQTLGQTSSAIDEFKKSVYIDRDCVLPYFSMACIYQSNSMRDDALREFTNAVRILEKLQDDEIIQYSGGLTVRLLTQICQKNIQALEKLPVTGEA